MELKDAILTPIFLLLIYGLALLLRNRFYAKSNLKRYFIPALTVKIIGAISTGLIYQYYYKGGDTFTFFQGTEVIWDVFINSPLTAIKIIFTKAGSYDPETYRHVQKIWTYNDTSSFMVVKVASFFGFFCLNSYMPIALIFAFCSFIAIWLLFKTFIDLYPHLHKELAIAILFIPSVFFWGSGLFKDTISLSSLALLTYASFNITLKTKNMLYNLIILAISVYFIIVIKIYILLSFLPPLLILILLTYRSKIGSAFLRNLLTPIIMLIAIGISFLLIAKLGEDSTKYSLNNLLDSAASMQRWHSYLSKTEAASGYNLGEIDPSITGVISKVPQAINVALFRPYLWEVKNPVMLMAALESTAIFLFTLWVFFKKGFIRFFRSIGKDPMILFCLIYALTFAFAVGFSSYNFGALVRYKIPCIPFFLISMVLIKQQNHTETTT